MTAQRALLEMLIHDAECGRPAALCAVLATRGSTPQTPGALMLVRGDGTIAGTVGGGAVEGQVRGRAVEFLRSGGAALLTFELDRDYGGGDELICGGRMAVGIVRVDQAALEPFRAAAEFLAARQPAAIPLVLRHGERELAYRVHIDVPPRLLIAGAGHVGRAVAHVAADLDFELAVFDDRSDLLAPERFPPGTALHLGDAAAALRVYPIAGDCYIVIVTRGHRGDRAALEAVVDRPAAYVGMIGSRRKIRLLLDDMARSGVPRAALDAVHAPIGLPIGAVTVPEIAISIAAELIQVRRQALPSLVEGPADVLAAT